MHLSILSQSQTAKFDKENIVLHIFHGCLSVNLKPFVGKNRLTVKNDDIKFLCGDLICFESALSFLAHFSQWAFQAQSSALLAFQPKLPFACKDQTFDFEGSRGTPLGAGWRSSAFSLRCSGV